MEDIPEYCLAIPKVATLMGITPEALTYRIKNNINDIQNYVIKVIFIKTEKFRYFINHTFFAEAFKDEKRKLTKAEKEKIEEYYYLLLETIEEQLVLKNKSVAKETQLWGDMPLVDMILCGKIFKFHAKKGSPVSVSMKKEIRKRVELLDFTNANSGILVLEALEDMIIKEKVC